MENGETIEESDTYVRLERDGSSEMVEAGKGNMVVNGDPIETVNPELLTKKRMGILYDRNGVVEHNGLRKNDKPYSSEFDGTMMDSRTESIILSEHSFNEVESFVFPPFLGSLKRIDIGDDCFGSIRSLKLTGLIKLESVKIEKRCFTHATSETQMFVEMGSDGAFEITDCPNLKSLQIGDFSFADYHLLEVEILPSLQQVVVGSYAFHWSYLFSLSGTAACFFTGRAS